MQGVFKVDEDLHSMERVFMYLELAHPDFDMVVDDFSLKKLPSVCSGGDLVRNGNFDNNGMYWIRYGNTLMDIESSPGRNLKVYQRASWDVGAYQYLYLDNGCLRQGERFQVTGKHPIHFLTKILLHMEPNIYTIFIIASKQVNLGSRVHQIALSINVIEKLIVVVMVTWHVVIYSCSHILLSLDMRMTILPRL